MPLCMPGYTPFSNTHLGNVFLESVDQLTYWPCVVPVCRDVGALTQQLKTTEHQLGGFSTSQDMSKPTIPYHSIQFHKSSSTVFLPPAFLLSDECDEHSMIVPHALCSYQGADWVHWYQQAGDAPIRCLAGETVSNKNKGHVGKHMCI